MTARKSTTTWIRIEEELSLTKPGKIRFLSNYFCLVFQLILVCLIKTLCNKALLQFCNFCCKFAIIFRLIHLYKPQNSIKFSLKITSFRYDPYYAMSLIYIP